LALDDEEDEDEDVFGDFEDLETGEKHDANEQKNGSDGKTSFRKKYLLAFFFWEMFWFIKYLFNMFHSIRTFKTYSNWEMTRIGCLISSQLVKSFKVELKKI